MMGRSTGCAIHRAALEAFAELGVRGPATAAAFDHLERCRRCEAEIAETILAVHAIRRLLAEARAVDPPADAWARLRQRVQRPVGDAWRARSSLAALALSACLVTAFVGPTAVIRTGDVSGREPGPAPEILRAQTTADQRAESAFLSRVRVAPQRSTAPAAVPTATWSGPDGLGRMAAPARVDVPPERAD